MYKILLVDDELIEREAIKFIIKKSNLAISDIMEAANGQDAIAIAKDFNPDIVILDIKMPGLSGIEVGHILKKINPNIKIVFMTAFDSFEYAHEAIKIGVEEFIVKPAPINKTIEILQSCISKLNEDKNKKYQNEKLEGKLNEVSHYLENEFLSSVVNGEIYEQQKDDYLKFMLSEFEVGFGVVIEVDFLSQTGVHQLQKNIVKKRFVEELSNLLEGSMKFLINQIKNTVYILVFRYQKELKTSLETMIEDKINMVSEHINEQIEANIFYGFGDSYNQISMLWKSFAQAKAASRNMWRDIVESGDELDTPMTTMELKEKELCLSIFNGHQDEMIRIADDILDHVVYATNDINVIRLSLYEFFILLNRYLNKESQLKYAVTDYLFDDLKNIESRGEARIYIHRYLLSMLDEIEEEKNNKIPAILDRAIDYIQENYDKGIQLEDVASEIGFSTYYFGKMFKKTFKSSFTDYLTNVRMTHSKRLLKEPNLSVKDITYKIGYMDPNYFTRVFKKSEGITPTEYRNQINKLK